MPLWGNTDSNTSAPKHLMTGLGQKNIATANATVAGTLTGDSLYQNVSSSVFVQGLQLGIFGVDAAEKANTTGEGRYPAHAGWVQRKIGTGFVQSITITAAGGGYANGFLTFSGGGGVNANASIITNGAGNVVSVVINDRGNSYNTAPTAVANLTNTSIATFSVTMGGRVGRKSYETLVAMGSMTPGANTDNAYFPE